MNYDIQLQIREMPKQLDPKLNGKAYFQDKEKDLWIFSDKMPNNSFGQEIAQFVITNNYGEVLGKEVFTQSQFGSLPMWANYYGRAATIINGNILKEPSLILHIPIKFFGKNGVPDQSMLEDLLTVTYLNKMTVEDNALVRQKIRDEYYTKQSTLRAVCHAYPTYNIDVLAGGVSGKSESDGGEPQPQ